MNIQNDLLKEISKIRGEFQAVVSRVSQTKSEQSQIQNQVHQFF